MKKYNSFIAGTLLLTGTGFLSRLIGFFYRTFLSRTFGEEGMGIYQLLAPIMALSFSLTAAGFQTALSKLVASEPTTHDYKTSLHYVLAGLGIIFPLSLGCTFFLLYYADFLSTSFLLEPRTAPLIRIFALSIPFGAVHSIVNGYFYGIRQAKIPAFTQILEQLVRVGSVFIICEQMQLHHRPLSISLAVIGLTLGECASMCVSLLMFFIRFSRLPLQSNCFHGFPHAPRQYFHFTGKILAMALPLSASRLTVNLLQSIEAVSIPNRLIAHGHSTSAALSIYGVLTGMVLPLILFPSALVGSACVLLLPVISEADSRNSRSTILLAVKKAIFYSTLFGIVCTIGFLIIGNPAGMILFHSRLSGNFILTLSFICPFLYLSSALTSILHGLGKAGMTFLFQTIVLMIRLGFVFFYIPAIGIRGYLLGLLFSQLLLTVFCLLAVRHYCRK